MSARKRFDLLNILRRRAGPAHTKTLAAIFLIVSSASASVGCKNPAGRVGPCLSVVEVLPDLGPDTVEDMGRAPDASPSNADTPSDTPDVAKDMGKPAPDAGERAVPEIPVHPCLSIMRELPEDESSSLSPSTPSIKRGEEPDRVTLLEKLSGRLPADVLAKLSDEIKA